MNKVPVFRPLISEDEIQAAVDALKLGWLGPGSYVREFEEAMIVYLGLNKKQYPVSVNTGTSAVHLALQLCAVGNGDEVITPSFNNIADFQAIKMLGANPVFCDIREENLTIDPTAIESLITKKTKAIICLDYASSLCDYNSVKALGESFNIPVIHDAAHAFGSEVQGKKVGSYSEICTFSFDPVKNITCIDGGLVLVSNQEHAEKLRYMRLLGQKQNQSILYQNDRSWTYDVDSIGYRYHLANLHAAIGLQQLKKIDSIGASRRSIFKYYTENFKVISGLIVPDLENDGIFPFIYVLRVLNSEREAFRNFLLEQGVDTGIHWQPGHMFSYFKNEKKGSLNVTEQIAKEIVTIPLYPNMNDNEINRVVEAIKDFFKKKLK